ncbi:MAG: restriction endonuclease subunit S [Chloroflexota bacterium]
MSALRSSWPEVTLGDVCEFKYGKSLPESARAGGSVPVFGSNGQVGNHDEALTEGPTIVIGRKGSFGEVNFSPSACWPIDTTYFVDSTATKADLRWLAYRLAALGLNKLNKAAAVPGLNREDAYRQRLLLPPLPEQRRIAEILDKADALRAMRRAALAQLDTLTQSIFLDMFGDPATNPKGWPVHKMEDVAKIVSGATPRTDDESYWDGEVNWVTPKELSALERIYISGTERRITQRGLESCAASILPPGSVLFSSRAPIGHTAICTVPMATNQGFKSFVPHPSVLEPHFLLFWLRLRRSFLEGLGTGATFKEVSKAVVARIDLYVPPFDLQSQFAGRVVAVERVRAMQREEREQLDVLFASLQHRAFRGEL